MSSLFTNPLKKKYPFGYKFGDRTFYHTKHIGIDFICPKGTGIYSIMDGICYTRYGYQGGKQIWQYSKDGNTRVRYMHLSSFRIINMDWVNNSERIGLSGNTGVFTTAPHLHLDIQINGKFVDPMKYLYIDNLLKNMTQEEFNELMKGYLKIDSRIKQAKNGSVWIVGKGKRYKVPANQSLVASFLVADWLTDSDMKLPVAKNQGDVL